jgi:hypothetical protein
MGRTVEKNTNKPKRGIKGSTSNPDFHMGRNGTVEKY